MERSNFNLYRYLIVVITIGIVVFSSLWVVKLSEHRQLPEYIEGKIIDRNEFIYRNQYYYVMEQGCTFESNEKIEVGTQIEMKRIDCKYHLAD